MTKRANYFNEAAIARDERFKANALCQSRSGYNIGQQAIFQLADLILDGEFLLFHA